MNMNKTRAPTVGLLALLLALPVSAAGQQAAETEGNRAAALAEAEALRKEAAELYGTAANRWGEVVRLHLKAAKIAPPDDPGRVQDLWMAGSVSQGIGNLRAAQRHMEAAGDLALKLKDHYRAGEAYVAAAILAAQQGRAWQASRLLNRAERAADAELIDLERCDYLRQRIAKLRGGSS